MQVVIILLLKLKMVLKYKVNQDEMINKNKKG